MTEHDHAGHRERLRARFLAKGLDAFSDHEVLEFILTFAIRQKDTKPIAKALLKEFKSLRGVLAADPKALTAIDGIGEHSAILLRLVHETCGRLLRSEVFDRRSLSSPQALYDYCRISLGTQPREQFRAYFLNAKNEYLAEEMLYEGTVDQTVVYPRTVVELALRHKAVSVIFAHNHPSGNLQPSTHDIELTKTLKKALEPLNIRVCDHLIITETGYLSFHEKGFI